MLAVVATIKVKPGMEMGKGSEQCTTHQEDAR